MLFCYQPQPMVLMIQAALPGHASSALHLAVHAPALADFHAHLTRIKDVLPLAVPVTAEQHILVHAPADAAAVHAVQGARPQRLAARTVEQLHAANHRRSDAVLPTEQGAL